MYTGRKKSERGVGLISEKRQRIEFWDTSNCQIKKYSSKSTIELYAMTPCTEK